MLNFLRLSVVVILLSTSLASNRSESKILHFIFISVFNKESVNVFIEDGGKKDALKNSKFTIVESCEKADILYSDKKLTGCNKPIFTNSYKFLLQEQSAIGAFYWQKGRPNIVFFSNRLDKFQLQPNNKLDKYIIDEF